MSEHERILCICTGDTVDPGCQSPIHPTSSRRWQPPPKQQAPTLITVATLREALANIPQGLDQALVLCNGKPAHTIEIHPDGEQPVLNIKFYALGDL